MGHGIHHCTSVLLHLRQADRQHPQAGGASVPAAKKPCREGQEGTRGVVREGPSEAKPSTPWDPHCYSLQKGYIRQIWQKRTKTWKYDMEVRLLYCDLALMLTPPVSSCVWVQRQDRKMRVPL